MPLLTVFLSDSTTVTVLSTRVNLIKDSVFIEPSLSIIKFVYLFLVLSELFRPLVLNCCRMENFIYSHFLICRQLHMLYHRLLPRPIQDEKLTSISQMTIFYLSGCRMHGSICSIDTLTSKNVNA
jgi:hypothetical protein